MMTNIEHDLIVALRNLHTAAMLAATESAQMRVARQNANQLLKKHDPDYTCPICDGGPGNHCACRCPQG